MADDKFAAFLDGLYMGGSISASVRDDANAAHAEALAEAETKMMKLRGEWMTMAAMRDEWRRQYHETTKQLSGFVEQREQLRGDARRFAELVYVSRHEEADRDRAYEWILADNARAEKEAG